MVKDTGLIGQAPPMQRQGRDEEREKKEGRKKETEDLLSTCVISGPLVFTKYRGLLF